MMFMKCSKCGKPMKEGDKFCPSCKAKAPSRFSSKVQAETKENNRKKAMKQKESNRQKTIVETKGLKNQYIIPAFVFGLAGTILILYPAGVQNQMQWWYIASTLICGITGYVLSYKARKLNAQYYQRYRAYVNPGLMKAALYLSSFTIFGIVLIITSILPAYLNM